MKNKGWGNRRGRRTGEKRDEREKKGRWVGAVHIPTSYCSVSLKIYGNSVIKLNLDPGAFLIPHGHCCL